MDSVTMHIVDRRLNPGARASANRQRFLRRAQGTWCSRRCAKLARTAASATSTRAARSPSRPTACASRRFRRGRRAACATSCCPATRSIVEGDTHPAPAGRRRRAAAARAAADGERRGRLPLRPVARRIPRPLPRRSRTARPRQAARRRGARTTQLAPRRLLGRPARRPTSRSRRTHADIAVAPHRAEAPEAGGDRRARAQRLEEAERRRQPPRSSGSRAELEALRHKRARIPFHRSDRPALSPLRARAQAGRAGGDVLPDGRVRLDDRAHEGSGQALLHAALPVPDAPLQARRDRLHPPHATRPRRWTRRPSSTPPRPAARWSRPRCEEMQRVVARALSAPSDWNIYAAQASDGDNLLQRQSADARTAAERRSCRSASISPISR